MEKLNGNENIIYFVIFSNCLFQKKKLFNNGTHVK